MTAALRRKKWMSNKFVYKTTWPATTPSSDHAPTVAYLFSSSVTLPTVCAMMNEKSKTGAMAFSGPSCPPM